MHIDEFLRTAVTKRASDIHIKSGCPPMLRIDGRIVPTEMRPLTPSDTKQALYSILSNTQREEFELKHELDFSFMVSGLARFRVNLYHEQGHVGAVFRVIPLKITPLDKLGVPSVIKKMCNESQGLILVTGPTGSGKSTLLAGMIEHINTSMDLHVVTAEDPIEFVFRHKKSIITQRELYNDTGSFSVALKAALRQDPDIILIGEMRDQETILSALKAAETGHLVLSTLHTTDAVQTINRIVNAFPPHEQTQIRLQLGNTLRACVAQRLVPKSTGVGRVAVHEIMIATPTVRDYILKNDIESIYTAVAQGGYDGMQSMNMSLYQHYQEGNVSLEDALSYSDNQNELQQMMRGAFHGSK
ncbi:type IV pilus twitching motility protein PilT [bacterium]|nr:MAG: type IV pilus twitching motility protein PilT [bacterium]